MHHLAALLATAAIAVAQLPVAIASTGAVQRLDPATGALTSVGPGIARLRSLATDGNDLWSVQPQGNGSGTGIGTLVRIDANNGTALPIATVRDYQALTWDPVTRALYGYGLGGTTSARMFVDRIDPVTGASVEVAAWARAVGIPGGFVAHQGFLFAWDAIAGLTRIDLSTGATTLILATGFTNLDAMCSLPDGRLLAMRRQLIGSEVCTLDPATANLTHVAFTSTQVVGLVMQGNPRIELGQGCADAGGTTSLRLLGTGFTGTTVTSVSDHHALGTLGMVLFGLDATSWNGNALPLSLDPLFGTQGCALRIRPDASLLLAVPTLPPGDLTVSFTVPSIARGTTLYMQHACLAPVPGHMAWTNGLAFTIAN